MSMLTAPSFPLSREEREDRATFLVHFGAGFLVWFLHLPLLGVVASRIDLLWRFKVRFSVTSIDRVTVMMGGLMATEGCEVVSYEL